MSMTESASSNNATVIAVDRGGGKQSVSIQKDVSPTLATTHYGEPVVCYPVKKDESVGLDLHNLAVTGGGNHDIIKR